MRAARLAMRGVAARGLGPVDLELASGAYGCLLGPAGAGKTVWLRAVAGLATSSGEVLVDGAALAGMPVRRRGFAMLATAPARQRVRRVPFASVGGWLRFAQRSRAGRRPPGLEPLLSEFELDGAADPARLDERGWFRARLAAALAGEPRLLLLDDPLAGWGDITAGVELLRIAARRRGLTVLHATRRRDEAFALADRLVLLEGGRVLQAGTASGLYDRPDTLANACRLGAANVLAGRIVSVENDVALVRLECGPEIEADPPDRDVPPESACHVVLRPERVSVSPLPSAELGGGAIAAVVRELTHRGDTIRLVLAIGTDADIVVVRPAAIGARGLEVGRTVSVAWQSRHALTYVGDASAGNAAGDRS